MDSSLYTIAIVKLKEVKKRIIIINKKRRNIDLDIWG